MARKMHKVVKAANEFKSRSWYQKSLYYFILLLTWFFFRKNLLHRGVHGALMSKYAIAPWSLAHTPARLTKVTLCRKAGAPYENCRHSHISNL
jgi:hypothetical protein